MASSGTIQPLSVDRESASQVSSPLAPAYNLIVSLLRQANYPEDKPPVLTKKSTLLEGSGIRLLVLQD